MAAIAKEEFSKRLLARQRARKRREGRARERFFDTYTIESCLQSIDQRRKYLNGRRDL
ncbi:MAG: hypothetical protein AB9836_06115 [Aminipila sp.]|nr:hypothetical protein [uncultured Aminipila sp.]